MGNSKQRSSQRISFRVVFFFNISDLPMSITYFTDVLLTDDTSILITDNNYNDFKQKINLILSSVSQSISFKYYENKHSQIQSHKHCSIHIWYLNIKIQLQRKQQVQHFWVCILIITWTGNNILTKYFENWAMLVLKLGNCFLFRIQRLYK